MFAAALLFPEIEAACYGIVTMAGPLAQAGGWGLCGILGVIFVTPVSVLERIDRV
jgi:hypothetical protein